MLTHQKFINKRESIKKYDAVLGDTSDLRNYNSLQVNKNSINVCRAKIQTQHKKRMSIIKIEDHSRNELLGNLNSSPA